MSNVWGKAANQRPREIAPRCQSRVRGEHRQWQARVSRKKCALPVMAKRPRCGRIGVWVSGSADVPGRCWRHSRANARRMGTSGRMRRAKTARTSDNERGPVPGNTGPQGKEERKDLILPVLYHNPQEMCVKVALGFSKTCVKIKRGTRQLEAEERSSALPESMGGRSSIHADEWRSTLSSIR